MDAIPPSHSGEFFDIDRGDILALAMRILLRQLSTRAHMFDAPTIAEILRTSLDQYDRKEYF